MTENKDQTYREESIVSANDRLNAMVSAHWAYLQGLHNTSADPKRKYTFDGVMAIREFEYKSAAKHFYGHGFEDALNQEKYIPMSMEAAIALQRTWALNTFGHGRHTEQLIDHITKELEEIRKSPGDSVEWIDIIILAFEGAWRTGVLPRELVELFKMKMNINIERKWPKPEDRVKGKAVEHIEDTHD